MRRGERRCRAEHTFAGPRPQAATETPCGGVQAISASLIDRTVQTQINAGTLAGLAQAGPGVGSNPMENVRYAFFQGSPFIFRVNLGPEGSDVDRQTIYLTEWNWGWQLKRVLVAPYLLKLGG